MRWAHGLGLGGASIAAALATAPSVPPIARAMVPERARALTDLAVWPSRPMLHQFIVYALILAAGAGGAALYAIFARATARRPRAVAIGSGAVALLGLVLALRISVPMAALTAGWLVVTTPLLSACTRPRPGARDEDAPAAFEVGLVLAAEALSGAWGAYLATAHLGRTVVASALGVVAIAAAWRLLRAGRRPLASGDARATMATSSRGAFVDEAVRAAPMLALPLAGLTRAPSWLWLAVATALTATLHAPGPTRRIAAYVRFDVLARVAAPAALIAVLAIPLRLRELPSENHFGHESQHAGWVASALLGRMMMADASTFYGPLREYSLAAWLAVSGVTLEQLRVGFVVQNLVGVVALLAGARHLMERRGALVLWLALMVAAVSPLRYLLVYWDALSLGWVDVGRVGFNFAALVGATRALTSGRAPAWRHLAWGAAACAAALYSQEFGLCALVALVLAFAAHGALAGEPRAAARAAGLHAAGLALGALLWLAPYAVFGRAGRFLRTAEEILRLSGSGAIGGLELPLDLDTFRSFAALTDDGNFGPLIEFVVPPVVFAAGLAVLVARAVFRRFDARSTRLAAVVLFGAISYRFAANRADPFHLTVPMATAALVATALLADAFVAGRTLGRANRAAALATALTLAASLRLDGVASSVLERAKAVASGAEAPARGPRYAYAGVARAGDMRVSEDLIAAARFVMDTTRPTDPIFVRVDFMSGMEVYFLTGRRNPTRFDMVSEILWTPYQVELLASLRADPPVLVVGTFRDFVGEDVSRLFDARWEHVATFGRYEIARRRPRRQAP